MTASLAVPSFRSHRWSSIAAANVPRPVDNATRQKARSESFFVEIPQLDEWVQKNGIINMLKKTGYYLPEMHMFQKAMVGPGRKKGRVLWLNHPEMCTNEF